MCAEDIDKKKRLEFTAKFIEGVKPSDKEERYTDVKTPGLTLAVYPASVWKPNGSKKWRYRYVFSGKAKMLSLGDYPTISLKAHEMPKLVAEGIDPAPPRASWRPLLTQRVLASFCAVLTNQKAVKLILWPWPCK